MLSVAKEPSDAAYSKAGPLIARYLEDCARDRAMCETASQNSSAAA